MRYSDLLEEETQDDGLYVAAYFHPDSIAALTELQDKIGVPNRHHPNGLHTTIVYSRKTIPWEANENLEEVYARPVGWEVFPSSSGTKRVLVLLIESPYLRSRFDEAMARGATYDFDEYRPHISLSYDVGPDFDHNTLIIPDFDIAITHEVKAKVID